VRGIAADLEAACNFLEQKVHAASRPPTGRVAERGWKGRRMPLDGRFVEASVLVSERGHCVSMSSALRVIALFSNSPVTTDCEETM